MPTPFEIGRSVGTNLGSSFENLQDESAIDRILKQKYNNQDPNAINAILGQLATQVSPTNRQQGMEMFSHRQKAEQQKIQSANQRKAYQTAGLDESLADLDPSIAKEIIKNQQSTDNKKDLSGPLNAINKMESLLGNPGIGLSGSLNFTDKALFNRGEFSALQAALMPLFKSMFPRGMTEKEFKFVNENYIPQAGDTEEKTKGKIKGLKQLLSDQSGIPYQAETIEMKNAEGKVFDIPKEYEAQARQQGYS